MFRQLFDPVSCTYTYLLADERSREAIIIDPVLEKIELYGQLINELGIKLLYTLDTHTHADHVTASGKLGQQFHCEVTTGERSKALHVTLRLKDGETLKLGELTLTSMYTPGHTDDCYSYLCNDRVFTGDTLLIRGTGRTDFQSGDSIAQYDSLFNKLLKLPEHTYVYPAHDYKGMTMSTIGEEIRYNPRLQVSSPEEYAEIMDNLNLARPKMMDVAVPANLQSGLINETHEA